MNCTHQNASNTHKIYEKKRLTTKMNDVILQSDKIIRALSIYSLL